jgi:hypothetical protein
MVETGLWLSHRKVLISPIAIGKRNGTLQRLPARLTREQVRKSPSIDTNIPVSRQQEREFCGYYGYPYYWRHGGLWAIEHYSGAPHARTGNGSSCFEFLAARVGHERLANGSDRSQGDDPRLRSCKSVTEFHIHTSDGETCDVRGMLVEKDSWAIRYLIVSTRNSGLGRRVLIAPESITDVRGLGRKVTVDLTCQAVQAAPTYDLALLPDSAGEPLIYDQDGREGCWQFDALLPLSHWAESWRARALRRARANHAIKAT